MSTTTFLSLLTAYSIISGLIVEAIKKLLSDKESRPSNLIALIVAVIVGLVGTFTYYQLSGISITVNNVIYALLLGFASGIASMVGYDKVKQAIDQIIGGKN